MILRSFSLKCDRCGTRTVEQDTRKDAIRFARRWQWLLLAERKPAPRRDLCPECRAKQEEGGTRP